MQFCCIASLEGASEEFISFIPFNSRCRVHAYGEVSSKFIRARGVCQGYPCSSFLSNFVIEVIMKITVFHLEITALILIQTGTCLI